MYFSNKRLDFLVVFHLQGDSTSFMNVDLKRHNDCSYLIFLGTAVSTLGMTFCMKNKGSLIE